MSNNQHPVRVSGLTLMKSRIVRGLLSVLTVAAVACPSVMAQDKPREDKIILTQSSADGLIADLEVMVRKLAKKQKQWATNIEPNIELFLDGVDRKKPIRVDVFFDEQLGEYYRPHFPITSLTQFRNNLDALGITSERIQNDLYRLESAFEGQMRVLPGYAVFAPTEFVKVIPADLSDPLPELKPLTTAKYDAAVLIDHQAEGIEARRSSLNGVIEKTLAEIKKKSTESVDQHQLRRLLVENRLKSWQRWYAELDYLEAGWVTDEQKNEGVGTLIMSGLPGTSLAATLSKIPDLKTRFATVPQTTDFVATGRILLPVDEGYQSRLEATNKALLPVLSSRIDQDQDLNAEQKAAAKEVAQKIMTLAEKGGQLGAVDLFFEVRKAAKADLYESVTGFRVVAGKDVEEILELLPKTRSGLVLKKDVAEGDGFKFHELTLSQKAPPLFTALYGSPCKVVLGVSDGVVLIGLGEEALPWLQQTAQIISKQTEPVTVKEFIHVKGHVGPLVKALTQTPPNKENPRVREFLVEAFTAGDDYLELIDRYEDGQVRGQLKTGAGLLRLIGLAVANFAEENL